MYIYVILYMIFISLFLNKNHIYIHTLHYVVCEFYSSKDIFWKEVFRQETYMYIKAKNIEWYSMPDEKISHLCMWN